MICIDKKKCIGCKRCVDICPSNLLLMKNHLLKIYELRELLTVARVLIEHLKARRETRWAGFGQNLDFPNRDEKFNLFVNSVTKSGETQIIFRELE